MRRKQQPTDTYRWNGRSWKRITAVLSVMVAVATISSLVLPGITMSQEVCEAAEHQHTEACYAEAAPLLTCTPETLGLHTHAPACYENNEPVCAQADYVVHTHDDSCYDAAGTLVCVLPEVKEHTHDDSCWEQVDSDPGHTHGDACYVWVRSEAPVCGEAWAEEHSAHTDDCYEWVTGTEVICGLEEAEGHAHTDACYAQGQGDAPVCGLEEREGHTHAADCYEKQRTDTLLCGQHVHNDNCYAYEKGELICGQEERPAVEGERTLICEKEEVILHSHTDSCWTIVEADPDEVEETDTIVGESGDKLLKKVLVCTQPEVLAHQHTADCFTAQEPELICTLPEHTHDDTCKLPQQEDTPAENLSVVILGDAAVTITAPAEAALPGDTTVTASPVFDSNEPAVAAFSLLEEAPAGEDSSVYVNAIVNKIDWGEVTRIKLYDISLYSGDGEVQPAVPVEVCTEFAEPLAIDSAELIYGVHFGADGLELLPTRTQRNENGDIVSVTHTQSGFSKTGYVLVHMKNEKDVGPDSLPVHYCVWVNNQWVIAGSSRTGWYGEYPRHDQFVEPGGGQARDYITVAQMEHVLAPYGLRLTKDPITGDIALTETDINTIAKSIWYQRAEEDGKTIRHDTTPKQQKVTLANDDEGIAWIFELSGNRVKDDGYHIYYVPNGVSEEVDNNKNATYASNAKLGQALPIQSKFFTLEVRDMNGVVYGADEELPATITALYGTRVEVTVRCNNGGDVNEKGWQWVNDKGQVVHGINRKFWTDTDNDGTADAWVEDNRFGYTENEDGTETYSFSGILGRTTLIPYSSAVDGAESDKAHMIDIAVHLDGTWQNVGHISVQYRKTGTSEADEICDGQWFVTAGQLYSYLEDFGFNPSTYDPDDEEQNYRKFTYIEVSFDEWMEGDTDPKMQICEKNEKIDETTFAVGLGNATETPKNYTLFYLPGSDNETATLVKGYGAKEYGESAYIINDRFFSITVADDYQLVYYGHETTGFEVYVQEGTVSAAADTDTPDTGEGGSGGDDTETGLPGVKRIGPVSVTVENVEDVLWSVRESWSVGDDHPTYQAAAYTRDNGVDSTTTYTFTAIHGPIIIEASSANPSFTVEYYADIERYGILKDTDVEDKNNDGEPDLPEGVDQLLPLINTEGKKLPTNSATLPLRYLELKKTGKNTNQNHGTKTSLYAVNNEPVDSEIYKQQTYEYRYANTWENIDKLFGNPGYWISEIRILKDGKNPLSTQPEDFWTYKIAHENINISFTNEASKETIPKDPTVNEYPVSEDGYTILITEGMIMRLNYTLRDNGTLVSAASFYDYNISNGNKNVGQKGINSFNTNESTANVYAFGNDNCLTGTGTAKWNGNYINQYNKDVYKGCSFGLVQSISDTGVITWGGDNLRGPEIFQSGTTGTQQYSGDLTFSRKGDVYTLTSANVTNAGSRSDLEYFFNPSPDNSTTYDHIHTNNFWVLDNAKNAVDPMWGLSGGTVQMTGYSTENDNERGSTETDNLSKEAKSDDGNNHNSFFGMSFAVQFNVSDYIGPMEYLFFGDDDMWVFLDIDNNGDGTYEASHLICDIGGVHSSVGEYVDLRDYLPVKDAAEELIDYSKNVSRLRFYYTERGSSGSTCWMSFTLPSVTSVTTEEGVSAVHVTKALQDLEGTAIESPEEFLFQVNFYADAEHTSLVKTSFPMQIRKHDGTLKSNNNISSEMQIRICAGETATIRGVPIGTYYEITEALDEEDDRFLVYGNGTQLKTSPYSVSGETVSTSDNMNSFVNVRLGYLLPETGGTGSLPYVIGGGAMIAIASALLYRQKRKQRKEAG